MFRRIISATVLTAFVWSAVSPAHAQPVDADKILHRKQSIHECLLAIYTAQKKRPLVLAEYQALIGLKPANPKYRYDYGVFLLHGNTPADFNAAIVQLKKAEELEPGKPEIYGTLATVYRKLNNLDESLKYLGKAVQYGGGDDYKKRYTELATFIQQKKQYEIQAKKILAQRKAIEAQKKKMENPDGTKKDTDDDDDW